MGDAHWINELRTLLWAEWALEVVPTMAPACVIYTKRVWLCSCTCDKVHIIEPLDVKILAERLAKLKCLLNLSQYVLLEVAQCDLSPPDILNGLGYDVVLSKWAGDSVQLIINNCIGFFIILTGCLIWMHWIRHTVCQLVSPVTLGLAANGREVGGNNTERLQIEWWLSSQLPIDV